MFDFNNFSLFFLKGSTVFNYRQFKEDKNLYNNIATIGMLSTKKIDEIEKCDVFLKDGRILKNVFVFNSSMLLYMTYWSSKGGAVHDAVEKYLFDITESIFNKYNFREIDILKIETIDNKAKWKKIFRKSFNDNDLLVQIVKSTSNP